jgi:hypothetical protein
VSPRDLVCVYGDIEKDRIPLSLLKRYGSVYHYKANGGNILSAEDVKWILGTIKSYPFAWLMHIKLVGRISEYSYIIKKYAPKAIAATCEYSFCSSLLTEYCSRHNVLHINFMHGEKIYYIRDSYFKFDECYVWDKHYVDLFTTLRAYEHQFVVELPPSFVNFRHSKKDDEVHDYCYYLAGEDVEHLDRIFSSLVQLKNKGFKVYVRMHPRWSNVEYIKQLSSETGILIEQPAITINESILTYKNAISLFSTVLYQSHLAGVNVIIDDYSDRTKFEFIKAADYICFKYPHKLLSNEIND